MKTRFILSAALILLSGIGLAFAAPAGKSAAVKENPAPQSIDSSKNFKDILFKLVRQDESLDAALDALNPAKPLKPRALSAMGTTLEKIAGNMNEVSILNKREFAGIQPDAKASNYTNAILSYSRKADRKAAQIGTLIAQLSARSKKASLRDAVSSSKGIKAKGKNLTQLLDEQIAIDTLAAHAKNLRGASRKLSATSNWLYIASK